MLHRIIHLIHLHILIHIHFHTRLCSIIHRLHVIHVHLHWPGGISHFIHIHILHRILHHFGLIHFPLAHIHFPGWFCTIAGHFFFVSIQILYRDFLYCCFLFLLNCFLMSSIHFHLHVFHIVLMLLSRQTF